VIPPLLDALFEQVLPEVMPYVEEELLGIIEAEKTDGPAQTAACLVQASPLGYNEHADYQFKENQFMTGYGGFIVQTPRGKPLAEYAIQVRPTVCTAEGSVGTPTVLVPVDNSSPGTPEIPQEPTAVTGKKTKIPVPAATAAAEGGGNRQGPTRRNFRRRPRGAFTCPAIRDQLKMGVNLAADLKEEDRMAKRGSKAYKVAQLEADGDFQGAPTEPVGTTNMTVGELQRKIETSRREMIGEYDGRRKNGPKVIVSLPSDPEEPVIVGTIPETPKKVRRGNAEAYPPPETDPYAEDSGRKLDQYANYAAVDMSGVGGTYHKVMPALLDTGASVCLITTEIAKEILGQTFRQKVYRPKEVIKAGTASGSVTLDAAAMLVAKIAGIEMKQEFFVVDKLPAEVGCILGMDFMLNHEVNLLPLAACYRVRGMGPYSCIDNRTLAMLSEHAHKERGWNLRLHKAVVVYPRRAIQINVPANMITPNGKQDPKAPYPERGDTVFEPSIALTNTELIPLSAAYPAHLDALPFRLVNASYDTQFLPEGMLLGCLKTLGVPNEGTGDAAVYQVVEDQDLLNLKEALNFKKNRQLKDNEFVIIDNSEPLANVVKRHKDRMILELGEKLVSNIMADVVEVSDLMKKDLEAKQASGIPEPRAAFKGRTTRGYVQSRA